PRPPPQPPLFPYTTLFRSVTEHSPDGSIYQEFPNSWGYPLNAGVGANGWARDLDKIFTNLYVVDSWDKATWLTVSASNGTVGVRSEEHTSELQSPCNLVCR